MSALVDMAGTSSRFSVKASSLLSGEMAQRAAAFERKGRNVVRVVGRQVADCVGVERQCKQVRALVAGKGIPGLIEQVIEDAGFDLAGALIGVAGGGALAGVEVLRAQGGAVGIDLGG